MEHEGNIYAANRDFYLSWFDLFKTLLSDTAPDAGIKEEYASLCRLSSERDDLWIAVLFNRLALSEFERFSVLLAFGAGTDTAIADMCEKSGGCKDYGEPGVALAIKLYEKAATQRLSGVDFSAGFNRLMNGEVSGINSSLRLTKAALRLLSGYVPEINGCTCEIYGNLSPLSHDMDLQQKLSGLLSGATADSPVVVQLVGEEGSGRSFRLKKLSEENAVPLLLIDARRLPSEKGGLDSLLDDLYLTLVIAPSMVCLLEYEPSPDLTRFVRELQKYAAFFCLTTKKASAMPEFKQGTLSLTLEIPALSRMTRKLIWERAFTANGMETDFDIRPIVNQYSLTCGSIEKAAYQLKCRQDAGLPHGEDALREIIELSAHKNLQNGLARLIKSKFGWDDIILPDSLKERLREICERLIYADVVMEKWGFGDKYPYGGGMSILFYGAPGTGKTMAAHVIANELKTPLYYVDFSNMIDKYIGETEKHIMELFNQAKQSSAILFFDEADALFAKRSGVSDATDRYANAQTACLLQCIEDYDGVVILATNLLSNFDEAFKRRIRYFLRFHHPDEPARKLIWQSVFPKNAPLSVEVDFAMLARTELSAGAIKNIALTAAFLAAENGEIKLSHLNRALRIEMEKDGQTIEPDGFEI